jgi:hypothetical protein
MLLAAPVLPGRRHDARELRLDHVRREVLRRGVRVERVDGGQVGMGRGDVALFLICRHGQVSREHGISAGPGGAG